MRSKKVWITISTAPARQHSAPRPTARVPGFSGGGLLVQLGLRQGLKGPTRRSAHALLRTLILRLPTVREAVALQAQCTEVPDLVHPAPPGALPRPRCPTVRSRRAPGSTRSRRSACSGGSAVPSRQTGRSGRGCRPVPRLVGIQNSHLGPTRWTSHHCADQAIQENAGVSPGRQESAECLTEGLRGEGTSHHTSTIEIGALRPHSAGRFWAVPPEISSSPWFLVGAPVPATQAARQRVSRRLGGSS